jgi:hypothetical protein
MTSPPAAAAAPAVRTRPLAPPVRAPRGPLAPARRPRRISGPVPASPARARRAARPTTAVRPAVVQRASQLLDRLIHGRAWIALVTFALIGIVTAQLGLLKLNAGIGRALEHEASLQRENAELSVEDSSATAGDAIQLQAAHMGMEIVPAGALRFLSARHVAGDATRAAVALNVAAAHAAEAAAHAAEAAAHAAEAAAVSTSAEVSSGSSEASTEVATEASASHTEETTSGAGTAETEAEGAQG